MPATVRVPTSRLAGGPGATQQWLDVSASAGFTSGTFESEGPLNASAASYTWGGLRAGTTYYWRVNSNADGGWEPSETSSFTPCPGNAAGVHYTFGTNVSADDQASVRDAIKLSVDYSNEAFGYEPRGFTVHAHQDVGELVNAIATWIGDTSPATIGEIHQQYSNPNLTILGRVVSGDGMFISTWVRPWTGSRSYRYLTIAHEYMHVVQSSLREGRGPRGTPIWLGEGSAEYFGVLVYARKLGIDYGTVRDTYIRGVSQVSESLLALESGGRFSSIADDSYPLAMLAFEFLIKDKGWQGLIDYYRAIGRGEDWQRAFTQSFGTPYDAFAGAFEAYRQNGYR